MTTVGLDYFELNYTDRFERIIENVHLKKFKSLNKQTLR